MKLRSVSFWLLHLALSASADARHAQVYTSNLSTKPWTESLSFSTFRAVLAQRLGVAQYHTLDDVDDDAIRALNAFQTPQQALFSQDEDSLSHQQKQFIVVVEDVDNVDDLSETKDDSLSFALPTPPSMKSTTKFLADVVDQYDDVNADGAQACGGADIAAAMKNELFNVIDFSTVEDHGCLSVLHGKLSERVRRSGLGPAGEHVPGADAGRYIVHALKDVATRSGDALVIVLVQPSQSSLFKRAESGSWGTYALPTRSAQKKPETDGAAAGAEDGQYRPQIKSSSSTSSSSSDGPAPTSRPGHDNDSGPARPTNTAPPLGILPACFESKSACEDTTHSCSGHGACTLKYDLSKSGGSGNNKRADGRAGTACWSCVCKADVQGEGAARRTVGWGGPACQKRDVSEGFWLLALSSIAMVGLIAWAVGLLVSMGNSELPSVIGAGVAGPRSR